MALLEMAKVSSRGQVAIPKEIRNLLGLQPGDKLIFTQEGGVVQLAKAEPKTFRELAEPFRKMKKKINEDEVADVIRGLRKKWRAEGRPGYEHLD